MDFTTLESSAILVCWRFLLKIFWGEVTSSWTPGEWKVYLGDMHVCDHVCASNAWNFKIHEKQPLYIHFWVNVKSDDLLNSICFPCNWYCSGLRHLTTPEDSRWFKEAPKGLRVKIADACRFAFAPPETLRSNSWLLSWSGGLVWYYFQAFHKMLGVLMDFSCEGPPWRMFLHKKW